jgi:plastocyanin
VLADASLVGAIPPSSAIIEIPRDAEALGPAAYGANPLVVAPGQTVVWTNGDTASHTVTSDTLVWDSGILAPGDSFFRVFPFRGTFPYRCVVHGAARMSGTIVVREPEPPDAH